MSSCKVFVGNLPWKVTTDDLTQMLQDMGYAFRSARVITDHDTRKSRGFAFVEFETPEAAAEAVANLDGHVVEGRPLRVNEADDKPRRGGGSRRGGRGLGDDGAWED